MAISKVKTTGAKARSKGWKRGARRGKYTDIQWNIACRIVNGFGFSGAKAKSSPAACPTTIQAKISLGDLQYGTCGVKYTRSVCTGVTTGNFPRTGEVAR